MIADAPIALSPALAAFIRAQALESIDDLIDDATDELTDPTDELIALKIIAIIADDLMTELTEHLT